VIGHVLLNHGAERHGNRRLRRGGCRGFLARGD
jgi:hypothetical protein